MLNFELKPQSRSKLYYDRYQYCLVFRLTHANFLRKLDHYDIEKAVTFRNWNVSHRPAWMSRVTAEQERDLHTVCDYLIARQKQSKRVVSGSGIWIYTNDIEPWRDIKTVCKNVIYSYSTEAQVCLPPDVVVRKYPRHQYRTYFKNCWVNETQLDTVRKYFLTRADQFDPSPAFYEVLCGKRQWISNYNFVDHNDAKLEFFINLACPGIVAKTMPIVARDK